ncbi:MAG: BatD family protein, partial [Kiritimatiellia bacterium]|nr:BatD family protein [Kiritimatiellia bacterium]
MHSTLLLCLLAGTTRSAEELHIKATANRDQIYIGESFILEIVVSGSIGPAEVDFGNLKSANIRSLGSRNISNYSITIVNGKMTREGFTGFISSYEVTPLASGRFQAGPVSVKIGAKLLTDQGPTVTVTDIEKQDRVILSVTASRETALIDEP